MKELYTKPQVIVDEYEAVDVLTASNGSVEQVYVPDDD